MATVHGLTKPEWMAEFERLKKLNREIMGGKRDKSSAQTEANQCQAVKVGA